MYVFLDTMVFLHYRPIKELNLTELLNVKPLTLVFPLITVRELNKQKDSGSTSKIKKRAKKILDMLKGLEPDHPIEIAPNIYGILDLSPTTPEDYGLDSYTSDNFLISSVINYTKLHSVENVTLISDDVTVEILCKKMFKVNVISPPDDKKLQDDKSQIEKDYAALKLETERSKNSKPNLSLNFIVNGEETTYLSGELRGEGLTDEEISLDIQAIIDKHPKRGYPEEAKFAAITRISNSDVDSYNAELEKFYKNLRKYGEGLKITDTVNHRSILANLRIKNTGSCPAENVNLLIKLSDEHLVLEEKEFLKCNPIKPEPPVFKAYFERSLNIAQSSLNAYRNFEMPDIPINKNLAAEYLEIDDHRLIRFTVKKIQHGSYIDIEPLRFVIRDGEIKPFSISYSIQPDNTTAPFVGDLHFNLNKIP